MSLYPTAAELLDAMAELLEEDVLATVPPELKHRVRVAASVARILQRDATFGLNVERSAQRVLTRLLDEEGAADDLRRRMAERVLSSDDPGYERVAWEAAVELTKGELSIVKPGHDAWEQG